MSALIFPACSTVELNRRNSTVPWENTLWSIEGVVPGLVVVQVAAILAAVPDLLEGPHGLGALAVELLDEPLIRGAAVGPPGGVHLEGRRTANPLC